MGKFKKGRGRDFESFSSAKRPRNPAGKLEMFGATCDRCGKSCEVPFRPTSGKPVFCSDCFRKNESQTSRPRQSESSGELDQINRKLDKILRALKIE